MDDVIMGSRDNTISAEIYAKGGRPSPSWVMVIIIITYAVVSPFILLLLLQYKNNTIHLSFAVDFFVLCAIKK